MATAATARVAPAGKSSAPKRNNAARVFGYDVFISFALGPPPRGTHSYASDLARRLRERDFTVFFSEDEASPGEQLDSTLLKALHRSRILVVIANRGTLQEPRWVRQEVEQFISSHPDRPIIPISIGGALQDTTLTEQTRKWLKFDDKIWLDEPEDAVAQGIASEELVTRLAMAPAGRSSNVKWRWVIRAVVAVLVVLTVVAIGFWIDAKRQQGIAEKDAVEAKRQQGIADKNAVEAQRQQRIAEVNATEARRQATIAQERQKEAERERNIAVARQLAAQSEALRVAAPELIERSVLLSIESVQTIPLTEGAQALQKSLSLIPKPIALLTQRLHPNSLTALAFSPDGRYLATGGLDGAGHVFDVGSNKELSWGPGGSGYVSSLTFSTDGRMLACLTHGALELREFPSGKEIGYLTLGEGAVAVRPDLKLVATAWDGVNANIYDIRTNKRKLSFPHAAHINTIDFSPSGGLLATGSDDKVVRLFDYESEKEIWHRFQSERVRFVKFAPDGHRLAAATYDHSVRVLDTSTGEEVSHWSHQGLLHAMTFSPDGRYIVTAGQDMTARISDVATGREVSRFAHQSVVTDALFSPDSRLVATVSKDHTVRVLEAETGQEMARFGYSNYGTAVAFTPDSRAFVTGNDDAHIRIFAASRETGVWRLPVEEAGLAAAIGSSGKSVVTGGFRGAIQQWTWPPPHEVWRAKLNHSTYAVAISPDGRYAAWGTSDLVNFGVSNETSAVIFDAITGRSVTPIPTTSSVNGMVFSPDSRFLIVGINTFDKSLEAWDVHTGKPAWNAKGVCPAPRPGAFGSNGDLLATACNVNGTADDTVCLFQTGSGKQLWCVDQAPKTQSLAISPDGLHMAIASYNKIMRVVAMRNRTEEFRWTYDSPVEAVAFTPDSKYLATGGDDGLVRIYEVQTGDEAMRQLLPGPVRAIGFDPTGRYLITIVRQTDVQQETYTLATRHLWRAADLVSEACLYLTRNLSRDEWKQYMPDVAYHKSCRSLP
jgi:WD40 repeat protein